MGLSALTNAVEKNVLRKTRPCVRAQMLALTMLSVASGLDWVQLSYSARVRNVSPESIQQNIDGLLYARPSARSKLSNDYMGASKSPLQ